LLASVGCFSSTDNNRGFSMDVILLSVLAVVVEGGGADDCNRCTLRSFLVVPEGGGSTCCGITDDELLFVNGTVSSPGANPASVVEGVCCFSTGNWTTVEIAAVDAILLGVVVVVAVELVFSNVFIVSDETVAAVASIKCASFSSI